MYHDGVNGEAIPHRGLGPVLVGTEIRKLIKRLTDGEDRRRTLHPAVDVDDDCASTLPRPITNHKPSACGHPRNWPGAYRTKHWQTLAKAVKVEAGNRCRACNSKGPLVAHHRTYENFGRENPGDVTALCKSCHAVIHRLHKELTPPRDGT